MLGARSSEAGASRPNAFGWCTTHQQRARCTCRLHREADAQCCSTPSCKVLPRTSRPWTVLPRGHDAHVLAWLQRACGQQLQLAGWLDVGEGAFGELDAMAILLPRCTCMPMLSTDAAGTYYRPSEAVPQVSCCRCLAGAPDASASSTSAHEHWRWIACPRRRCLTRFPSMQCIDGRPRPRPLMVLPRGHDVHVLAWLQRAASMGTDSMGAGSMWCEDLR